MKNLKICFYDTKNDLIGDVFVDTKIDKDVAYSLSAALSSVDCSVINYSHSTKIYNIGGDVVYFDGHTILGLMMSDYID